MQTQYLSRVFQQYTDNPAICNLHDRFKQCIVSRQFSSNELIQIYKATIPLLETTIWECDLPQDALNLYQKLFQELEGLYTLIPDENRYSFIVIIPIADRPQHLKTCLNSLLNLCRLYTYGGQSGSHYNKISVIIADDSAQPENIQLHRKLAELFSDQGLRTEYFGLEQQLEQINKLDSATQRQLHNILGNINHKRLYHKGASMMRNIVYLKLIELASQKDKLLFFFIDSDQEFRIRLSREQGNRDEYALNYFYYLNEIFSTTSAQVLTGKVVGDPPVSPAVMTSNFLDDLIRFLQQLSISNPDDSCGFHSHEHINPEGAYHDMGSLFGFTQQPTDFDYQCPLPGKHDHSHCLSHLAAILNHFFYGEHPTRSTSYQYEAVFDSIKAARTIYTGNYVLRSQALKYFIPFASLKLRMAGPVLGRIIKAELGDKFISASLPMLHGRTVEDIGRSEFRPGVIQDMHTVDLYDEFQRQYFGDVMLFTMEKLTASGFPGKTLCRNDIMQYLIETEQDMNQHYIDKHHDILDRLKSLTQIFNNPQHWWNTLPGFDNSKQQIRIFISNIHHNFGLDSRGYQLLTSYNQRKQQLPLMANAIIEYKDDREYWEQLLVNRCHTD